MREKLNCKDFKYVALSLIAFYLINSVFQKPGYTPSQSVNHTISFYITNSTFLPSSEYLAFLNNKDNYTFKHKPNRYCFFSGDFQNSFFKLIGTDGFHWFNANDPKHCDWRHKFFIKNNQKRNPMVTFHESDYILDVDYNSLLFNKYYKNPLGNHPEGSNTISVSAKPYNWAFLCLISSQSFCKTQFIAESIDLLYVVIPIYGLDQDLLRDMYILHEDFKHYLKTIGIPWIVIEAKYPDQEFIVSDPDKESLYIQLEVDETFYLRENLVNVAARKNKNWEYLTWIDAHQIFLNPYWWEETIYKLEKYATVQMFSEIIHFTECNNSFFQLGYSFQNLKRYRKTMITFPNYYGNAFGVRREIYEQVDHLLDECIASGCDTMWNFATFKDPADWNHWTYYPYYLAQLTPWLNNARKILAGNSNIVRGELVHIFHDHFYEYEYYLGCLSMGGYNLSTDVYRDENYLLHLNSSLLSSLFDRDE